MAKQSSEGKNKKQSCHDNYPSQSSRRLKCYVEKKYGGKVNCTKAARIMNDSDAPHYYKKAAAWYKNLHCKGRKQIREEEKAGKNENYTLNIFDIDNTLVQTKAKYKVLRPGKPPLELDEKQKNDYVLKPGEKFDDSEFESSEIFHKTASPIKTVWDRARKLASDVDKNPSSSVFIVTARQKMDDTDLFIQTFVKHGLDMSNVRVLYAGNLKKGSSPDNKKALIRTLIVAGPYTEVNFYDDKEENLEAFLRLKHEFPDVKLVAFLVNKHGNIITYYEKPE